MNFNVKLSTEVGDQAGGPAKKLGAKAHPATPLGSQLWLKTTQYGVARTINLTLKIDFDISFKVKVSYFYFEKLFPALHAHM